MIGDAIHIAWWKRLYSGRREVSRGVGGKCMPKGLGSSDLLTQQKPRNI
jgi:hypothetical protein